ncbi:MAG TPA: hypothetical protein VLC98_06730 [Phnomibacter sp.]|nr:hypothetical protein [Phnomibacter sp.]
MKISFFFALLMISTLSFGQNAMKFHHNLSQAILDRDGFELRTDDAANKPMKIGSKKLKCILASDGKGKITADFWQILDTPKAKKADPFANDPDTLNSKTATTKFLLTDNRKSLGEETFVLKVPFNAWTFSVGTTPMRIRSKTDSSNATVSAILNLSLGFGYTFGCSHITGRSSNSYSITVAPFLGLSTAELKKETVKTPKTWDNNKTYTRINPAISYGIGATFARNNFGIVVSGGFDHAVGDMADQWSYQNKFWLGFGVNTSLGILK